MISSDPNVDRDTFALACLLAARDVDTSPHYLVAVAVVESGIKNIPAPGSTGFGPFQILDGTWAQYMVDLKLTAADRFDPFLQPLVAARIAVDGITALVKILPG